MVVFAALIAAWFFIALVVGMVLGRGVRLADEREGQTAAPVASPIDRSLAA